LAGSAQKWFMRPKTVTHPRTNQARRNATSLIKTDALLLSQTANRHDSVKVN